MYCTSNNIRYVTKKVIKLNLNYRKLSTDTLAFDTRGTMLNHEVLFYTEKFEMSKTRD